MVHDVIKTLLVVGAMCSPSVLAVDCSLQKPSYECSASTLEVDFSKVNLKSCGGIYEKSLFMNQPRTVSYAGVDTKKIYTLAMVDPDAPRHGEDETYLHWLLTGLPGSDIAQGVITAGQPVMGYAPPTPPQGTGVHRYIFYLYEQLNKEQKFQTITKRGKFKLHTYAQQNELCGPVAQTMFSTQH